MNPGDRVDRYVIEASLGRGGMGEVYEALDTRLARKVALKILPAGADATATARMLREARAVAAFQHPNVVVVYDVGEGADQGEGQSYIAMELVRGQTLRRYIGDGEVPIGRRVRWLVDVAKALAAAHEAGLVHRDVKPDNVMVREDGVVKVLDFGIARRPTRAVDGSAPTEEGGLPTLTERGVLVGTPLYASPEQLRGESLDGRSDQFSWGVLAYELFAGKPPWEGASDQLALLSQILSGSVPDLAKRAPDLPPEVVTVVNRTLEKTSSARYPTMIELADALEPFADAKHASGRGTTVSAPAQTLATPPPTQIKRLARKTGRIAKTALTILGVLIGTAFALAAFTGRLHVGVVREDEKSDATVSSFGCQEATVEGEGATPLMKRAIGVGACARLATRLGVDWKNQGGQTPLVVHAKLGDHKAEVDLTAGGMTAHGTGPTPAEAMAPAIAELSKQLTAVPMTPEQVRAWGTASPESARRIERAWREMVLNESPDAAGSVRELLKTDGGSPWPHLFAALVFPRGGAEGEEERKKGIELAVNLPPARAEAVRGVLESFGNQPEGFARLRHAYEQTPDDGDIASLYAAVAVLMGSEEAFAVVDRLIEKFPSLSVLTLEDAIRSPRVRDLERDARYLAKLHALLPETEAWDNSVRLLAWRGQLTEARQALAFGEKFGLSGGGSDPADLLETRVQVELIAEDGAAVRALSSKLLGDPRPEVTASGARALIASFWLDGRFDEATDAMRHQIERLRWYAGPHERVDAIRDYALATWRLGYKPIDPALVDEAQKAVEASKLYPPAAKAGLKGLFVGLGVNDPKKARALIEPYLLEIEGLADKGQDRLERESTRLYGLQFVQIVRGNEAAADLWLETPHANRKARDGLALTAGMILENAGKPEQAEEAYRQAAGPFNAEQPLARMIAHIRLGELYRATGRPERAAPHDAVIHRAWKDVDPAMIERFKKLSR